ncbi:hypothetical protein ACPCDX_06255 [Streptomyces koyangensis]|uniref:hypothetical protein n=1 Tax=Streptomyces koyangensis TaxID=188770 RepID=UPI003C2FFCDE
MLRTAVGNPEWIFATFPRALATGRRELKYRAPQATAMSTQLAAVTAQGSSREPAPAGEDMRPA